MNSLEFIKQVQLNQIDPVENISIIFEKLKKIDKDYNYFNLLDEKYAIEQAKKINKKGLLAGLPISVKDNICVNGIETTASSKILTGYKPLFDATSVSLLKKEGAVIIGKTSNDAFGFGSFNTNVGIGFKIPKNPFDKDRSCGGSSGGSAGITKKADFPHISLAESTGGSIECPASFCGVAGFCPTYGRVSRYGLIDYANSLDKIGPLAKSVEEIALILEIICQYDEKDSTSLKVQKETFLKNLEHAPNVRKLRIGIIKESLGKGTDKRISDLFWDNINKMEKNGIKYEEVSLPLTTKFALETYYIIATSEASTNLAKYCGLRYGKHEKLHGNFNEYSTDVRTKNFDEETKRRVMLGTFARMSGFRDAFFIKATKVRTKIIDEYKKQLKKYDVLLSPTMPITAPKFSDIKLLTPLQNYMIDILTVGPNLAGLPHISVNMGVIDNLPSGIMIIGDHCQEQQVLKIGKVICDGI